MRSVFDKIGSCASINELWALVVEHFTMRGADGIGYLLLRRGEPDQPVAVFSHGLPPEFSQAYAERGYARHDPAARYALTSGRPVSFDQLPELTEISRKETALGALVDRLSLGSILVLPVFGPQSTNGVFGLSFRNKRETINALNWDEEQAVAQVIHTRILSLQQSIAASLANPLSERELEILRWIAQGKSNAVIAEILDLSMSTIDTYVRRIFQKLDVADRTAAAVRGISAGYIRL